MPTFTANITVACPSCGTSAALTFIEDIDPQRGTEGHEITFTCTSCRRQPPMSDLLKLWAANRRHPDPFDSRSTPLGGLGTISLPRSSR